MPAPGQTIAKTAMRDVRITRLAAQGVPYAEIAKIVGIGLLRVPRAIKRQIMYLNLYEAEEKKKMEEKKGA